MIVLIFDTETTGLLKHSLTPLHEQPHIIELAAILWNTTDNALEEYTTLLNPGVPLAPIITKITGLTAADLEGHPTFADVANTVASFFARGEMAVAHNVDFDLGMMKNELARCAFPKFPWPAQQVCTVRQYEHLFGHRPKLPQLYERILGTPLVQSHRALDDCRAVLAILQKDAANFLPPMKGGL